MANPRVLPLPWPAAPLHGSQGVPTALDGGVAYNCPLQLEARPGHAGNCTRRGMSLSCERRLTLASPCNLRPENVTLLVSFSENSCLVTRSISRCFKNL